MNVLDKRARDAILESIWIEVRPVCPSRLVLREVMDTASVKLVRCLDSERELRTLRSTLSRPLELGHRKQGV